MANEVQRSGWCRVEVQVAKVEENVRTTTHRKTNWNALARVAAETCFELMSPPCGADGYASSENMLYSVQLTQAVFFTCAPSQSAVTGRSCSLPAWRVPWEIIPGIPLRIGIFLLEYFFWNIFPCRYAIPHRGACRGIIV